MNINAPDCPSCSKRLASFDANRNTWWCGAELKEIKEWRSPPVSNTPIAPSTTPTTHVPDWTRIEKQPRRNLLFSIGDLCVSSFRHLQPGKRDVLYGEPLRAFVPKRMIVAGAMTSVEDGGTADLIIERLTIAGHDIDLQMFCDGPVRLSENLFSAKSLQTLPPCVSSWDHGIALHLYNPTAFATKHALSAAFIGSAATPEDVTAFPWKEWPKDSPSFAIRERMHEEHRQRMTRNEE